MNPMRQLLTVNLVCVPLLLACSHTPNTQSWPELAYPGFTSAIAQLAGPGAINCGFIDRRSGDQIHALLKSQACITKASSSGQPFRFVSVRAAATSYLYEAITSTAEGEFWSITFDSAMDGSENLHFVQQCEGISSIDIREAEFSGLKCQDVPTDHWIHFVKSSGVEERFKQEE